LRTSAQINTAQSEPARHPPERRTLSPHLHLYPNFPSRFLPDARDVFVHLPPGYDETPDRRYPVLYMHDGQNLFTPQDSFVHRPTWNLDESADAAIRAGEIEPLLIVGVANTGDRRLAEYTPTADWKMGGGEADKYGLLLTEELLPFLAAQYRVKPGPTNTGLGGSSLGALATLYLGLRHQQTFGKLALLSPSVWWNHRAILALVAEADLHHRPRVWLDIGDAESARAIPDADLLESRLRAKGWRPGLDLSYHHIAGGTHDESSWARRVQPMLRFLFPA
ncbi:MAG: alpha/beta hydrolase-fold protein, partial [Acidobacteriaceae bacterium]